MRHRFSIGRVCVVADRGMISAATIEELQARKLEYILGARERSDAIVVNTSENEASFTPLLVERKAGETQLFVKQVKNEGKRYIVCRNEAEAEKDRKDREAIVTALDAQWKNGDKRSMTGSSVATSAVLPGHISVQMAARRHRRSAPGSSASDRVGNPWNSHVRRASRRPRHRTRGLSCP